MGRPKIGCLAVFPERRRPSPGRGAGRGADLRWKENFRFEELLYSDRKTHSLYFVDDYFGYPEEYHTKQDLSRWFGGTGRTKSKSHVTVSSSF